MIKADGKNVLVTGSAGFIGAHIARALEADGWEVSRFDIADDSAQDILDEEALRSAVEGKTHVVHLAAKTSVAESMKNPEETKRVNEEGARRVFGAAKAAGARRIVYASSAAVYGDASALPNREDAAPDPLSPYAASKVRNEIDARAYPAIGLRFFNVYGRGQRADHPYASVIPKWAAAIASGGAPELFGDGEQTRDFVHVRDVARAVALALEKEGLSGGEVYNVGSGIERTMNSVWEDMKAAAEFEGNITRSTPREGDLRRSVADIGKANRELGWGPMVSFEDGLKELFA